jgi:hypothetical protein
MVQNLTGISQEYIEENGYSFEEAWEKFRRWIRDISEGHDGERQSVVLIAHNGHGYDFNIMKHEYTRMSQPKQTFLYQPQSMVYGARSKVAKDQKEQKERFEWCRSAGITHVLDSVQLLRHGDLWEKAIESNPKIEKEPTSKALQKLHLHLRPEETTDAHNALDDCEVLENILEYPGMHVHWREHAVGEGLITSTMDALRK